MTPPPVSTKPQPVPVEDERHRLQLEEVGQDLLLQTYVMMKTSRLYDHDNENYSRQLTRLMEVLERGFRLTNVVKLHAADGYFFFNDKRLRVRLDGYLANKYVQDVLETMGAGGFAFSEGVERSAVDQLFRRICTIDPNPTDDEASIERIHAEFESLNLPKIELAPRMNLSSSGSKPKTIREKRRMAKQIFFRAVGAAGEAVSQMAIDKPVNTTQLKRIVHSLIDQILSDETYLLELTALKNFDDYTFAHSINVSIYSITMGLRMGMSKQLLAELGFAAIFHDIGKTRIPKDLLNKPSALTSSDWEKVRRHPVDGVLVLSSSMTLDSHVARAMIVAFEHHKNLDGSGYPYINRTADLNLFSRIVAIADFFDALTSGRKYQEQFIGFNEALVELTKQSGKRFDPSLVRLFLRILGVYPTGTLLLLDSGELGIVISNNPEDIFRPRVRIIANTGGFVEKSSVVDLTAKDASGDRYVRNVRHIVDPKKYNIDISQFILADST